MYIIHILFYVHHSYSLFSLPSLQSLYLSFHFFTFPFISLPFLLFLYLSLYVFTFSLPYLPSTPVSLSIHPSIIFFIYLSMLVYSSLSVYIYIYIYIHLSIFSILPPYLSLSIYPSILPSYLSFSIFQFVMSIPSIITLYFYTIHLSIHLPYP